MRNANPLGPLAGVTRSLQTFLLRDSGAITVDWTVLAGALVGLGLGAVAAVRTGVIDLGGGVETSLSGSQTAELGILSYVPITASYANMDSWTNTLTNNWSDANLVWLYDLVSQYAQTYLDSGNLRYAGQYLDLLYVTQQQMAARGLSPSEGTRSLTELYRDYQAAAA
jgi:hypothetical protein